MRLFGFLILVLLLLADKTLLGQGAVGGTNAANPTSVGPLIFPPANYAVIDLSATFSSIAPQGIDSVALDDQNEAAFSFYTPTTSGTSYAFYPWTNGVLGIKRSLDVTPFEISGTAGDYSSGIVLAANATIYGTLLLWSSEIVQQIQYKDDGGLSYLSSIGPYIGNLSSTTPGFQETGATIQAVSPSGNGIGGIAWWGVTTTSTSSGYFVQSGSTTFFDSTLASSGYTASNTTVSGTDVIYIIALSDSGSAIISTNDSIPKSNLWDGRQFYQFSNSLFSLNNNGQALGSSYYTDQNGSQIYTYYVNSIPSGNFSSAQLPARASTTQSVQALLPGNLAAPLTNIQAIDISGTNTDGSISVLFTATYPTNPQATTFASGQFILTLLSGSSGSTLNQVSYPQNIVVNTPEAINASKIMIAKGVMTSSTDALLLLPVELSVDANRDGTIVPQNDPHNTTTNPNNLPIDTTTPNSPYRFWVNDDEDSDTSGDIVPAGTPDYDSNHIVSKRDLEDWTRLWISFKGDASLINVMVDRGYSIGLQFEPFPGDTTSPLPQIKVCEAVESSGSTGYIINDSIAGQQISGEFGTAIYENGVGYNQTIGSTPFILPSSFWSNVSDNTPKHLIFEGVGEGKGKLTLVFLDAHGNRIGEGGAVYLDIKNIKRMYQRGMALANNYAPPYSYPNGPSDPGVHLAADPNSDYIFQPPFGESPQCIVLVHGFNTTYAESTNTAETVFKRLWWRGYTGRLAAFRWALPESAFNGSVPEGAFGTYNNQEYFAWHTGAALKEYVNKAIPPSYAIDYVAHSMGNIVTGEALREGARSNYYALLHSAASASCYCTSSNGFPSVNTIKGTPDDPSTGGDDDDAESMSYYKWLASINSKTINFFDDQDSVITWKWEANNYLFKPQSFISVILPLNVYGYYYDRTQPYGEKLGYSNWFGVPRILEDPSESKSFAVFSACGTIGSADEGRQAQGGSILDSIDENEWSFADDHGNEWDWNIQKVQEFYWTLMFEFKLHQSYLDVLHPAE